MYVYRYIYINIYTHTHTPKKKKKKRTIIIPNMVPANIYLRLTMNLAFS